MRCYTPRVDIWKPGEFGQAMHHELAVFARRGDAMTAAERYAKAYRSRGWETGVSVAESYIWGTDYDIDEIPLAEGAVRVPDCYSEESMRIMARGIPLISDGTEERMCSCGVDMKMINGRWVCPACEPETYHTGDFLVSPWNGEDE